uniref:Uncharacterized protein n=1 Tax=Neospora caninum (strain Liverpool) TaxID=572307 RepID=A0A0F7UKT4_NEOCL|nr:TPA: hypothetical protein BN1204_064040 [Neospora caninum Liverpool]
MLVFPIYAGTKFTAEQSRGPSPDKVTPDTVTAEQPYGSGTNAHLQLSSAQEEPVERDSQIPASDKNATVQSGPFSHGAASLPESTLLYITETAAVEAAPSPSLPTTVDVYIAAFNWTMLHERSPSMFVTVYYGNGTEGDTLTAHVQEPQVQGVWKRPYSMQRSSNSLVRPNFDSAALWVTDHVDSSRISVAKYTDKMLATGYFEDHKDHRSVQVESLSSRRKKPGSTENHRRHARKLRRRGGNRANAYLQFQPAYGQDLHTFVHIAAGKVDAALAGSLLLNPQPKGDIYIHSVLEIPHAFRKWVDPDYAPLWDPEFIVTGDYWSSTLTPWYNTSSVSLTNGTYAMAEGFYKHRYASLTIHRASMIPGWFNVRPVFVVPNIMVINIDLEAARHETKKFMHLLGAQTTQNSRLTLKVIELTEKARFARQQLRIQSEGKAVHCASDFFNNDYWHGLAWRPLSSALKCRTHQNLKNASAFRELQRCQETIRRHTSEIESCEAQAVQRKLDLASQLENSRASAAEREASYKRAKASMPVDKEARISSLWRQIAEKKALMVQLTEGLCRLRATVASLKSEKQVLLKRHAKTVALLRSRFDAETKELQSEHSQSPDVIKKLEKEIEALEMVSSLQPHIRSLQQ